VTKLENGEWKVRGRGWLNEPATGDENNRTKTNSMAACTAQGRK